jgi:hypothetical protein
MTNCPVYRRTAVSLASLALALLSGCSSIESSSKMISSPFASSASSSKSSSPEAAYREDVSDYTAAHLQSGGTPDALRRQIGVLAEKHGITDWEHNQSTFQAVGQGLAKAGYKQVQVDAFKNNIAKTPEQAQWLQDGYDEAH